jgi:hypothetical protein
MTASLGITVGVGALFEVSPLGGVLGASTCSIFRLDPFTGTVPLEPLIDLVPGVTPLRVTFDMIDDELIEHSYALTTHALQDISDATSNVHKQLRKLTVSGTLSANLPIPSLFPLPFTALPNPLGLLRIDLIRLRHLQQIADDRQPVMVVTPRYAMARGFIESIKRSWKPDDGDSSNVVVSFQEARIVKPSVGPAIQADTPNQLPGNNAAAGGGQAAGASSAASATPSGTAGIPPSPIGPISNPSGG